MATFFEDWLDIPVGDPPPSADYVAVEESLSGWEIIGESSFYSSTNPYRSSRALAHPASDTIIRVISMANVGGTNHLRQYASVRHETGVNGSHGRILVLPNQNSWDERLEVRLRNVDGIIQLRRLSTELATDTLAGNGDLYEVLFDVEHLSGDDYAIRVKHWIAGEAEPSDYNINDTFTLENFGTTLYNGFQAYNTDPHLDVWGATDDGSAPPRSATVGGAISGTLELPDGTTASSGLMIALSPDRTSVETASVGSDGSWEFTGLSAGTWEVVGRTSDMQDAGGKDYTTQMREIDVS